MSYALYLNQSIIRKTARYHERAREIDLWRRISARMLCQRIEREQDESPAEFDAFWAHTAERFYGVRAPAAATPTHSNQPLSS